MSSRIAGVLAATVLLIAVAAASAPAGKSPGPREPDRVLVGLLLPFAGHTESGLTKVGTGTLGVVTRGGDPALTYELRLSRRTCKELEAGADRPRLVGPSLAGDEPFINTVWVDIDRTGVTARHVSAARSTVLAVRTAEGEFQPRACASAIKLQDVLVSSLRGGEIRGTAIIGRRSSGRTGLMVDIAGLPDGSYELVADTKRCSQRIAERDIVIETNVSSADGILVDKSTPKLLRSARPRSARIYSEDAGGQITQLACGTFGRG